MIAAYFTLPEREALPLGNIEAAYAVSVGGLYLLAGSSLLYTFKQVCALDEAFTSCLPSCNHLASRSAG